MYSGLFVDWGLDLDPGAPKCLTVSGSTTLVLIDGYITNLEADLS